MTSDFDITYFNILASGLNSTDCLRALSLYSRIDELLIEKYSSELVWEELSKNTCLEWSEALIERYERNWSWPCLSNNPALPWSAALINRFSKRWDWEQISINTHIPWTSSLISENKSYLNFGVNPDVIPNTGGYLQHKSDQQDAQAKFADDNLILLRGGLSANTSLPWSMDLIDRFRGYWEFSQLKRNSSIPWSQEILIMFRDRWQFHHIPNTRNPHHENLDKDPYFPGVWKKYWSSAFLENIREYVSWSSLSSDMPWDEAMICQFETVIDWSELGRKGNLDWTISIIEEYKDRWNWGVLSSNNFLPWSIFLIAEYEDKWLWGALSLNGSLPWSGELIDRFQSKWDWFWLSTNVNLLLTEDIIDRHSDSWDWFQLSRNEAVPLNKNWLINHTKLDYRAYFSSISEYSALTTELIDEFCDYLNWEELSRNPNLPWSADLLICYKDRWDWSKILEMGEMHGDISLNANVVAECSEYINLSEPNFLSLIEWTSKLMSEFKSQLDWDYVSDIKNLPWTHDLIAEFVNYWNWDRLSNNQSIPWTYDLITEFEDYWNWARLADNKSIKWPISMLKIYIKQNQQKDLTPKLSPEWLSTGSAISAKELPWELLNVSEIDAFLAPFLRSQDMPF